MALESKKLLAILKKPWPAFASAVLYCLAFPPLNFGLLVFAALVPWLLSLRNTDGKGAFRSGYTLGFLIVMYQMSFVQSLTIQWTHSFGLSFLPWLVCGFLGAFYFAILGWVIRYLLVREWIWFIPVVWAGMEVFRSMIPGLAFPWFIIANPLWPYPALIQNAYFGTIYFVSAWVVLVNLLIVGFMEGKGFLKLRPLLFAVLVLAAASSVRMGTEVQGAKKRVVIGQPGVDMAFGDPLQEGQKLGESIGEIFRKAQIRKADFVVLPEGLAPRSSGLPPIIPFSIPEGTAVIFGGQRMDTERKPGSEIAADSFPTYQSAYVYDGKWKYADKSRLVVFGEYVPGRQWIPFLDSFKLPSGDITPAEKTSAVDIAGVRAGPLICFEGLFWDVAHQQSMNGAQILTVMSIDDWYMGTPAPDQLRAASVWRAVETGLPVARSASLGYTMAVDQRGRVLSEAPSKEPSIVTVDFTIEKEPAKFALRPLFPWLSVLALAVFAVLAVVRPVKKEGEGR